MKPLSSLKALVILLVVLMYTQGCRNSNELSPTLNANRSTAPARISVAPVVVGPYTITFNGVSNNGFTWTYTIQRTGPAQANGLSHWIINLGSCVLYSNVQSASIDGAPYTDLASSEGSGTGCTPTGQFLKFDNLPGTLSDGQPHTFSFTLNVAVDVASVATYVKAGSNCTAGEVQGPGCFHICGDVVQEAVVTTTTVSSTLCSEDQSVVNTSQVTSTSSTTSAGAGIVVTLSGPSSLTVLTDELGHYCLTNLAPGDYTVSIPTVTPTGSETITVKPGQSQSISLPPSTDAASFTITTASSTTVNNAPVYVACTQGCSFSQGYWFAKPGLVWPSDVTVGGFGYSQALGTAIWNTSNAGGIPAAKKVFLQVAAIKLSGSSVLPTASVLADVKIADDWLKTLPQLTTTNLKTVLASTTPAQTAAAVAAADRISAWITANHCE